MTIILNSKRILDSTALVRQKIESLKYLLDQLKMDPEPLPLPLPLPLSASVSKKDNVEHPQSEKKPNKTVKKLKILCIGDSITKGFYDAHHHKLVHPYTMQLEKMISENFGKDFATLVNKGVGGETVHDSLKFRIIKELNADHYDMAIVLGGVNDLVQLDVLHRVNLPQELSSMLHEVSNLVNDTIALTILEAYPIKKKLKYITMKGLSDKRMEVNRRIRKLTSSKIGICDTATLFPQLSLSDQEFEKLWREDRVHPTPEGYDKLARIIYTCIEERLTKKARN